MHKTISIFLTGLIFTASATAGTLTKPLDLSVNLPKVESPKSDTKNNLMFLLVQAATAARGK